MRILPLAALLLTPALAQDSDPERPNLVLFLVDDLGWQDTSVNLAPERAPVNAHFHTPNVERLAVDGMVFPSGYASCPVCTPTRTSIQTGLSPARSRITYWTLHRDRDTTAKHPTLRAPKWNLNGLQPGAATLAGDLRQAGYRTIHVGKSHLGTVGTPGADPTQLGFERNVAGHGPGAPGSYYGKHDFRSKARRGEEGTSVWDVPDLEAYHGEDVYLTDVLAIEACREVREAVADGEPFYLNFCPYAVHTPIMEHPGRAGRYAGLTPREVAYATMVESMDAALGALLDTLEELEVLDETLIVFTSDNGGLSAHARGGTPNVHNAPLRSGKGSAYEGGVRVPWIVRWPGVVPAGSRCDVPVVSHDLFPTFHRAAGVPLPELALDGVDLTPLFRGQPADLDERRIVWNMPHSWGGKGPGIEPFTAMRRGRWKLYYFHTDQRLELYDLEADLGETTDLAAREAETAARLARDLGDWCEAHLVQMSVVQETGQPIPYPGR